MMPSAEFPLRTGTPSVCSEALSLLSGGCLMCPLFSVDAQSKSAYLSFGPSSAIARQVRVARGRTGRLCAVPFCRSLDAGPQIIAEYDTAGEVVGVQILGVTPEALSLAGEFLELVELSVPSTLGFAIDG